MKSFGGYRRTVAIAELKMSATEEQSDPSEAALYPPLMLFQDDPLSPEELLQCLHFFPL